MKTGRIRHFFAGGNTGVGFYSFYDQVVGPDPNHLYILKGGPGTGKSTFMRQIGEELFARDRLARRVSRDALVLADPLGELVLVEALGVVQVHGVARRAFELGAARAHVAQSQQGSGAGQVERQAEHAHAAQRLESGQAGGRGQGGGGHARVFKNWPGIYPICPRPAGGASFPPATARGRAGPHWPKSSGRPT